MAEGEFSNIVNNPIWQTVKIAHVKAKILRFDADRLAEDEGLLERQWERLRVGASAGMRMAFSDFEVVIDK